MYVIWIMMAYLLMFIVRTVAGPSVWDRLLGMCLISTKLTIIIIVFASINNIAYLLDFAIIYTLFGFISVIFITFFLLDRTKGRK
ncbi:MAG: monovalent cation/H+ antiporter complex subunit F [Oscillospiraceae bacterium]|nr:monovalent cation/H+ antiporter complex subunit F [Oscillospiraceae bacterium]